MALRQIAMAIRKNHKEQLALIEGYLQNITQVRSSWDDSAYNALFEAVRLQYIKLRTLIDDTADFPQYLEKLADAIAENKKLGGAGVL
ncbi:MAG TPA: hypothetical protein O0X40_04345 [Methanocorpusculum sp.]|nr:hypothetical protein [Methanocorpusculum sp.]